jgi:ABC-type polysaccharide/polyol phosphate transport system ATPase subunit
MMNAIEVRGLNKKFDSNFGMLKNNEHYALEGITLSVKKGEFIGIIGPNGAGKSTLLKIISGILEPTKGKVVVRGEMLSFIELGVGFNDELTGRENTFLYSTLLGIPKNLVKDNINSIISFSGLKDFFDAKLRTYSTGMRIRLAFSVAALCKPDILLIDEILAVGDEEFQEKSLTYIQNLNDDGTTIILVSHDLNSIKNLCHTCVLLIDGKLNFIGSPESAIEKYRDYIDKLSNISNDSIRKKIIELNAKQKVGQNGFFDIFFAKKKLNNISLIEDKARLHNEIIKKIDLCFIKLDKIYIQITSSPSKQIYLEKIKLLQNLIFLFKSEEQLSDKKKIKRIVDKLFEYVDAYEKLIQFNNIKLNSDILRHERELLTNENKIYKENIHELHEAIDSYLNKKYNPNFINYNLGFGTKQVVITKVTFNGKFSSKLPTFYTGKPFSIEINYQTDSSIENPMIGIALHTKEGIWITGPNTTFSNFKLGKLNSFGKIRFSIDKLPLLSGEYDLSVSIYDYLGQIAVDHHYRRYRFKVINNENPEIYGIVHIPHRWEIVN